MRSFLRIIGNSGKGALWIVLAVLLADALAEQFILIRNNLENLLTGCALLIPIVVVSVLGVWLIYRSDDERYLTRVALAIVGVSLLSRLVWIIAVDSYQVNDFGEYLNNATDITDTLWRRAAFYTYPLVLAFGKSIPAVKVANVLLATLTAWIFFLAGRIVVGTRVAVTGLLLFIWHADLWYSITLASHDVPGLFWLGLFFYLCALLQRRLWTHSKSWLFNSALSVFLGGCIFFVGAVRSYQYGAILALAACSVIHAALILFPGIRERAWRAGSLDSRLRLGTSIGARFGLALLHTALLLTVPLAVYQFAEAKVWKAFKVEFDGIGPGLALG